MQQFSIPCDFGGKKIPCTFYIGQPEETHHPLFFQADWISKERGGIVPKEVMDSIQKLQEIALRNNVPLVELCKHALISANFSPAVEDLGAPGANAEVSAKQVPAGTPVASNGNEEAARILAVENAATGLERENPEAIIAQELDKAEKEQIREDMLTEEANLKKQDKITSI